MPTYTAVGTTKQLSFLCSTSNKESSSHFVIPAVSYQVTHLVYPETVVTTQMFTVICMGILQGGLLNA